MAPRTSHFPSRDRLSVLTAMILLAYALARVLELPTRQVSTNLLGSPLGLELNSSVFMLVVVAGLIAAGSDSLIRSHPRLGGRSTLLHWIVPGATALVLGSVLNQTAPGPVWWLGLGLSALALVAVLVAEYIVVDRSDPAWEAAALGLTAVAYGLALLLFALLRSLSARALISASLSGLLAAALALRLFGLRRALPWPALLYAGLAGAVTAEVVWALSYWRVASASSAGLLALVPFYVLVGLAQQHLAGRLSRRVWIEYAVVGAAGLAIALFNTRVSD
jgi:hypothetical protein